MTEAANRVTANGGSRSATDQTRIRRERREDLVRHAEYSAFPRVSMDQRERVGFTRDLSPSGLCLRVQHAEPLGSLLRVIVRDVDGRPTLESVARVTWRRPASGGDWWVGLCLVDRRAEVRLPRRPSRPLSGPRTDLRIERR